MKRNILAIVSVVVLVTATAWWKHRAPAASQPAAGAMPRLIELGAGKCAACIEMAPIIEAVRADYAGKVQVESIDVMQQADAARVYDWTVIPTQVFFDAEGTEVWRHVGSLERAEIDRRLKAILAGAPIVDPPASATEERP